MCQRDLGSLFFSAIFPISQLLQEAAARLNYLQDMW